MIMNDNRVSQEELLRYISGTASLEEMAEISLAIKNNPELKDLVELLEKMNKNGNLDESQSLPASDCAGDGEDNLCDVLCEKYILKDYLKDNDKCKIENVEINHWMKESGTPLHNVGRILEKYGMVVTRHYDCTVNDLIQGINNKKKIIAIVDSGELWEQQANGIFHAVVCISITPEIVHVYDPAVDTDTMIRLYDPATESNANYNLESFLKAWRYSHNYLVTASSEGLEYQPHPIDISDVDLDEELVELTESIAENAHEIWAVMRKNEGWKYGKQRNDKTLEHPDMVPYSELPESEKSYDRDLAMHTIRLVKKLGFDIHRKYTLYCPHCGEFISEDMKFCPNCGKAMNWDNLI